LVAITPGKTALKLLLENKPPSLYDCEDLLAKNGLDFYDNKVKTTFDPTGKFVHYYERIPPLVDQQFEIFMDTARGGQVKTRFGWYEDSTKTTARPIYPSSLK
jgi:hypothetical protein